MYPWISGGNMKILYSYIKDNNFIYPVTYKDGYIYIQESMKTLIKKYTHFLMDFYLHQIQHHCEDVSEFYKFNNSFAIPLKIKDDTIYFCVLVTGGKNVIWEYLFMETTKYIKFNNPIILIENNS